MQLRIALCLIRADCCRFRHNILVDTFHRWWYSWSMLSSDELQTNIAVTANCASRNIGFPGDPPQIIATRHALASRLQRPPYYLLLQRLPWRHHSVFLILTLGYHHCVANDISQSTPSVTTNGPCNWDPVIPEWPTGHQPYQANI